ncbi:MAG: tetratricopeptide repeat protein [Promethearchaeota archaeon]
MSLSELKEYIEKGQFQKAHDLVEQAEIYKKLTNGEQLAWRYQKALILIQLGNFEAGLRIAQELLEDNLTQNNPQLIIDINIIIAEAHWRLDKVTKALRILEHSHQILKSFQGDLLEKDFLVRKATILYYEAAVLLNIGEAIFYSSDTNTDNFNLIKEKAERSLEIFEKLSHSKGIAQVQQILGVYWWRNNDSETALSYLHESLDFYTKLNHKVAIADTLEKIGIYYYANAVDYNLAIEYHKKSLDVREELNYSYGIARSYYFLGDIYRDLLKGKPVLEYLQKSLEIMEQLGNKHKIAEILHRFGLWYFFSFEDLSLASEYFHKSLKSYEDLKNRKGMAFCYNRLASLAYFSGDFLQAQKYIQQSLDLWNEIGIRSLGYHLSLVVKGWLVRDIGHLDEALAFFQEALLVSEKLGLVIHIHQALQDIGNIYRLKGEYKSALEYFKRCYSIISSCDSSKWIDLWIGWACFYLILLIVHHFPHEDITPYINKLEQTKKEDASPWMDINYKVCKALYLKTSTRLRDHFRAQQILEKLVEEGRDSYPRLHGFVAEVTLCELLLLELKVSGENVVLQEIKSLMQKIRSTAEQNKFIPLLIEISILQARLQYVEGELESAMTLLNETKAIAEKENLHSLVIKISSEKLSLEGDFEKWQELIDRNAPIQERLKQAKVGEYLKIAQDFVLSMQ